MINSIFIILCSVIEYHSSVENIVNFCSQVKTPVNNDCFQSNCAINPIADSKAFEKYEWYNSL